jgi:hypothetical protein
MNLKCTQLHHQKTYPSIDEVPTKPEFPSARYFQVHFEHMETQLIDNKRCMDQLQQQMAELYRQLALLTTDSINLKVEK